MICTLWLGSKWRRGGDKAREDREFDEDGCESGSSGDDFKERPKDVRWEPAAAAAADDDDDATGDLERAEDLVGADTARLLRLLSLPLPPLLADTSPPSSPSLASSSPSLHTMTGALLFKFCLQD
jgi:hypothetical protein